MLLLLFARICAKITDEENNGNGNGLGDAVVGLAEDNKTVQHVVAPTPTSNEIPSTQQSNSLPLNNTDKTDSLVVVSGKFVVSVTYSTVL
jgi:hypothetical protein